MKIYRDKIGYLTLCGQATLQIPQFELVIGSNDGRELIDAPDDWFVSIAGSGVPSRQGYLFLTRKGWLANKEYLRGVFDRCDPEQRRVSSWEEFESAIDRELQERDVSRRKEIERLRRRIDYLEAVDL